MINIAWALGSALLTGILLTVLEMHWAIGLVMGLLVGFVVFFILGRKMQEKLEGIMTNAGKEIQNQKLERAIEVLKSGLIYKNHHIFIEKQLNSQIGMLYYVLKKEEKALEYLSKGFFKAPAAQCMLACIYYKRKDMDNVKKVMEDTVKANAKDSLCYALYAYFLENTKEHEAAIKWVQKGLAKMPNDEKLTTNLILLQNQKKMKMKVYGDVWVQLMLEKPPRIMQEPPKHMRFNKRAMFRG
ncbi:MAG: hypothetical protein KDC71_20110 [Acidobacteria bacterium]|nr:hypothetical protein [Acidobacteriota bacterium]